MSRERNEEVKEIDRTCADEKKFLLQQAEKKKKKRFLLLYYCRDTTQAFIPSFHRGLLADRSTGRSID